MRRRLLLSLAIPLIVVLAMAAQGSPALGHPDHDSGGREMFPGEGVIHGDQHGGTEGHLPAAQRGVRLVGKAQVTNPAGTGLEGRIADVSAYGNYAFLAAFREPTCERAGAHVINIANPSQPFEVQSAFMETTPNNYAGEGSDVIEMHNQYFNGVLFMHQNETCPGAPAPTEPRTRGGINVWNITDPERPQLLVKHAGDYSAPDGTLEAQANQTHSQFAWTNEFTGRTYVVLVDDEELTDIDILDITDPRNPVMVNDTLNLDEPPFDVDQANPANLTSVFSHDMMVQKVGNRYVMNMSYWDGGYVLLDVTNPTPGNVKLIAESDYALLDEERLARGHEISPEGNGHQSELSPDMRWLVATDEDFNPYRVVATITSGPYAGTPFTAIAAPGAAPINENTSIIGTPTYVGLGCDVASIPAGIGGVALIERGVCTFQQKLDNVKAAGYTAGIVFNALRSDCLALVSMLATGDIPFVFVNRTTGLKLLGAPNVSDANACTTPTPTPTTVASVEIKAVFDGWGYIRLFRTNIPTRPGATGSIQQIDTFAIPESQDPKFARGWGDLSVHEVALDPNEKLAYVSHYAGGFRILKYGEAGLQEVGVYIDKDGNNFWGVEVHNIGDQQYVLASDRDYGLFIFQPDL